MSYHNEKAFIKNRKSFNVAPYALADVIEALANDDEHFVDICVTKEDGKLMVMFNRIYRNREQHDMQCEGGMMSPNIKEETK
jgi:hypothetical protein